MRYKLHVTHAGQPDMLNKAISGALDIGHIHVWANGVPMPKIGDAATITHEPGLVTTVSLINMCIQSSWEDDVMFWMHDDAYAHPGFAAKLLKLAEDKLASGERWGAIFTQYDALAAFNMAALREVGLWDTMFYQYTADIDYYYRMKLANWPIIEPADLRAGVDHYGSSVVKTNNLHAYLTAFRDRTNFDHAYYAFKWGGKPGNERSAKPFPGFDPNVNIKNRQWGLPTPNRGQKA